MGRRDKYQVLAVVGSIVVIGTLGIVSLIMCFESHTYEYASNLNWELTLSEFELSHNIAEATKKLLRES